MKAKRLLALASFLSCLLCLYAGTASADFVGLSFTGTDSATGVPVTGAFQYDPAQFSLNSSGNYVTSSAGAATIGFIVNGATKYTTSSDQNVPIEAIVAGNANGGNTFSIEIVGPAQGVGGVCCSSNPTADVGLSYSGSPLSQLPTSLAGVKFSAGSFGYSQFSPLPNASVAGLVNISSIGPLPGTSFNNPLISDNGNYGCGNTAISILCFVAAGIVLGLVLDPGIATGYMLQIVSGGVFLSAGLPPASIVPNPGNYTVTAGTTTQRAGPGGKVTFPQGGVSQFIITGIDPSLSNTGAFPVFLSLLADGNPVQIQMVPTTVTRTVCCKDLSGDGKADIVWRNDSGEVYEWLTNGLGIIGQGAVAAVGNDWQIAGIGDFNGDGRGDIL